MSNQHDNDSAFILFVIIAFIAWPLFRFGLPLIIAAVEWLMRVTGAG